MKKLITSNLLILSIVLFSLAVRLLVFKSHAPFWDASVYILMGKYFFSFGQIGFIEPFRPILWPLFLGFIWKLGADPILWARISLLLFSAGNIILIYLIGKKVYDRPTGIIAALFLGLSSSFIFWGSWAYADIPASFFGLLTVYLFFQNRHFLSGITGTLAFFTKFTQLLTVVFLAGISAFERFFFKRSSGFVKFIAGFVLFSSPFLIFHLFIYGNMFQPFIEGSAIYDQIPYQWHEGIVFCVRMLFKIESWIFIFLPVSIYSLLRYDPRNKKKIAISAIGLSLFALFGKLPTYLDLPRFLVPALPYLYLLSADGLRRSFYYLKKRNRMCSYFLAVIILIIFGTQFYRIKTMRFPKDQPNVFQEYVMANEAKLNGLTLWISDPAAFVFSNLRVQEIMYYPIFDLRKIVDLHSRLFEADVIFWDSRAMVCVPANDLSCQRAKEELVAGIVQNFDAEILERNDSGQVIYGIFKR